MYLRSMGNPPSKYVNLLHYTQYDGAKRSAPSEHEFASIISNAGNVQAPGATSSSSSAPAPAPAAAPRPAYGAQPAAPAPAAPAPRGAPPPGPRPAPPAPRAPAAPVVPEDNVTEWYYIDKAGTQKGPVFQAAIKADWKAGLVDGECIGWNGSLADWVKISSLEPLMTYLKA